jgi:hypothetical protein
VGLWINPRTFFFFFFFFFENQEDNKSHAIFGFRKYFLVSRWLQMDISSRIYRVIIDISFVTSSARLN